MSAPTIPLADARPGDHAEGKYDGHPFSGEVWENEYSSLFVGATCIRYPTYTAQHEAVSNLTITRPAPALPTEVGTVGRVNIYDAEYNVRAMLADDGLWAATDGCWYTTNEIDGSTFVLELAGESNV